MIPSEDAARVRDCLDGNAAAGLLSEVFAAEPTTASGTCRHCGHCTVLADVDAYLNAMGLVLRCRACEDVILRVVNIGSDIVLDTSGLRSLRLRRDSTW